VLIELDHELEIDMMGFKSAGNCPHRDPDSVAVSYEKDLSNKKKAKFKQTNLGTFPLDFGGQRWHVLQFPELKCKTRQVKLEFANKKGPKEI